MRASCLMALGLLLATPLCGCGDDDGGDNEPPDRDGAMADASTGGEVDAGPVEGNDAAMCPQAIKEVTAKRLTGCGGVPLGTFQLTHIELSTATVSIAGGGSCPVNKVADGDVPEARMTLREGGSADYHTLGPTFRASWSNACLTGQQATLTCDDDALAGYSDCELDCDRCTCTTSSQDFQNAVGTWGRTEEALTLQLWGVTGAYGYCLTGDTLALASDAGYFEFERVYPMGAPTACADRKASHCELGYGCQLGACEGDGDCGLSTDELSCLTRPTCTWQPKSCVGAGQPHCLLGDYGRVPGCELLDTPGICDEDAGTCSE